MAADVLQWAMLGSAKIPAPALPTDALATLVDRLDPTADPVKRLLLYIGMTAGVRRAGGLVDDASADTPPTPAPTDPTPICSVKVADVVRRCLSADHQDQLALALQRISQHGLRLPDELLVPVIRFGPKLNGSAGRSTLGQRGRWLSQFVADWSWLATHTDDRPDAYTPESAEKLWKEGSPTERQAVLTWGRRHHPDHARQWLIDVWKTEKADARAKFLAEFSVGLSMDDEGFLNGALDDRSQNVKQQAAELLSQLPHSAFAQQAVERVKSLIEGTGVKWSITPPTALPPDWTKAGVGAKSPIGGNDRDWQLAQVIGWVELGEWEKLLGQPPTKLLADARTQDFGAGIVWGWTRALLARSSPCPWARVLWSHWTTPPERQSYTDPMTQWAWQQFDVLLSRMTDEDRDDVLASVLDASTHPLAVEAIITAMERSPAIWPADFGATWVKTVSRQVDADAARGSIDPLSRLCQRLMPLASFRLPAPIAAGLVDAVADWRRIDKLPAGWGRPLQVLDERLQLRKTLDQELPS